MFKQTKNPSSVMMKGSKSGGYLLSHKRSTIGVAELNDPVRNGKGWDLSAKTTSIGGLTIDVKATSYKFNFIYKDISLFKHINYNGG